MVMHEEDSQGRNHRYHDEQTEGYPHCNLAPAATAQATGELTEALDGSRRAEGVVLGLRHSGSLLWAHRLLPAPDNTGSRQVSPPVGERRGVFHDPA